jgi:hypothetical protein
VLLKTLKSASFRPPDSEHFTTGDRDWVFEFEKQYSRLEIVEPFGLQGLGLEEIFITVHGYKIEVNGTVKYHLDVTAKCLDYRERGIPMKLGNGKFDEVQIVLEWDANQLRGPCSSERFKSWNEMPWDEILRLLRLRAATQFNEHGRWRSMEDFKRVALDLGPMFP